MIETYDAYLFDLDGVITPTVDVHMRAWQETFDAVFAEHGVPPFSDADYHSYVDGKPRLEGVSSMLAARGIVLPMGGPSDEGLGSVHGIGNRKNRAFVEVLERDGIEAYPGTLRLLDSLEQRPLAIVSSSRNAESVLAAAGLRGRFGPVVDGLVAADRGIPGKPQPDTFVYASELLDTTPERSVVFEDAESGVRAARAGGFGLIVGVNRGVGEAVLTAAGADIVVNDLEELLP